MLGFLIGFAIGGFAGIMFVAYAVWSSNEQAIKSRIIKLNGKLFTLTEIDL